MKYWLSRTELPWSYSRLLSCATLVYIPALLWCTFLHYSSVHSHTTPVCVPMLLQSILLHYSSPPLDWTGLHSTCLFDQTCAWPDMGSSCHSPVTYVPISCHLYLLVPSLFPAHIYFDLPISTSVIFASHWQWLRYALHLLISSLLTYCTSLGTYFPLSSLCYWHHNYCLIIDKISMVSKLSNIINQEREEPLGAECYTGQQFLSVSTCGIRNVLTPPMQSHWRFYPCNTHMQSNFMSQSFSTDTTQGQFFTHFKRPQQTQPRSPQNGWEWD